METLEEKIKRVTSEEVDIAEYDPRWRELFEDEKKFLLTCLPAGIVNRVEHFGSTAVRGLASKPIVDMLVEVTSLEQTKTIIAPILESLGYDYFWRPSWGDNTPPFYAWFIKRDKNGVRTHHIHMVEKDFEHWDRLLFRDYLIGHPDVAREYCELKKRICIEYSGDRIAYTKAKTDFITRITELAKKYYSQKKDNVNDE